MNGSTEAFDPFVCPLDGVRMLEASAGTGKTWTLAALVLRLVLEADIGIDRLLVVTFTRPATAELRARIRAQLGAVRRHIGRPDPADPFAVALLEAAARKGVGAELARERLERALARFDEAAIYTIHGFRQRALAEVPFAAGLPMRFEVVADDDETLMQACADFWRRHVAGADLDPALVQVLAEAGDSPARWAGLLGRRLAQPLARILWNREPPAAPGPAALLASLRDTFDTAREHWHALGAPAPLMASAPLRRNVYTPTAIEQAIGCWQAWLDAGDPLEVPAVDSVAKPAERLALLGARRLATATRKGGTPPSHPFFDAAQVLLDAREAVLADARLRRHRLLRTMLVEAGAQARASKRARRVLAYDDLLRELREALGDPRLAWLPDTLRARWPAALIDEFQDTDAQQFTIFETIYGRARANDTRRGPLFMVGDPKQAIYAFRNADVHAYLAARTFADARESLDANQRATPALIDASNRLFERNPDAFMLDGLDCPPVRVGAKHRPVLVDGSAPADAASQAALRVAWLSPDGELPSRGAARRRAAAACAGEAARLLTAARDGRIRIDGAALRAADIAVLVRTHAQARMVRDALRARGVGSVELARESIFATADAADLERVLLAVVDPGRGPALRAALATTAEGFDAAALAAMDADDAGASAAFERYAAYRETWLARGVGLMLAAWTTEAGVRERVLARPDGERRLTNLLHLAEVLQEAQPHHDSPHALLHWFARRRADAGADEETQLRLESDENLVKVVTIHKAKGLEFPIVFCPFLWEAEGPPRANGAGRSYHVGNELVLDLRDEPDDTEQLKARIRDEADAEAVRLLYVALTRAVHRCYLVAGIYLSAAGGSVSDKPGRGSLLNWLVAGQGPRRDWREAPPSAVDLEAAWQGFAAAGAPGVSIAPLDVQPLALAPAMIADPASLRAQPPPERIDSGWRVGSFSSLAAALADAPAADHDALAALLVDDDEAPDGTDSADSADAADAAGGIDAADRDATRAQADDDDFLRFPRGPAAGDCVHALLENALLDAPATWEPAIAEALLAHPPGGDGESASPDAQARGLRRLLADLAQACLPGGIPLRAIGRHDRLVEMGFHFPARSLDAAALRDWLAAIGQPAPTLGFARLDGYLTGYVDLVLRHEGRYHVLDWKSNHLGMRASDYAPARLAATISAHVYALQASIYALAVHRLLARRLAGYDYARHFGGVHYAFVRGMRPQWAAADGSTHGVWTMRPSLAQLAALERIVDGAAR